MNFFSDVGYYHSGLLFFKIIEPAAISQPFETRSERLELQKFVNSKYVIVYDSNCNSAIMRTLTTKI